MFEAVIIACVLPFMQLEADCLSQHEITDNWGPYATRQECVERLDEMAQVLSGYPFAPFPHSVRLERYCNGPEELDA